MIQVTKSTTVAAILLIAQSLVSIEQTQAGCPFQFNTNGDAPNFVQQQVFKGPFSSCDNFGNCEIVKTGKQNLQATPDGNGPAASAEGNEVCIDELPPHSSFKSCEELASAFGGCAENTGFCNRTCASCSPVFVSQFGKRSGTPYDIDQDDELALGAAFYLPKLDRKKCESYDVDAVKEFAAGVFNAGYADIPTAIRMGFHDAGDYNKYSGTGGADGRFLNNPETWYGQSRSVNQGTLCVKQLLKQFSSTSLSAGDAIQICHFTAVEVAGGPLFQEFNFTPGRVPVKGVTQDGMLPGPNGNQATLRDYMYRAGFNDLDIVTILGAHTIGGGNGATGSGYTGAFTDTPDVFDNSYYTNLIKYAEVTSNGCDYFEKKPSQRAENGGCHVGPNELLQLPTDRALIVDPVFRKHVETFASDQQAFFDQYVITAKKMSEFGMDVSVQYCDYNKK